MLKGGRLCGWTFVEAEKTGPGVLWLDMNSLAQRLKRYFGNVRVIEHTHPTNEPPRQVLAFYASDDMVPFDPEWPRGVKRAQQFGTGRLLHARWRVPAG